LKSNDHDAFIMQRLLFKELIRRFYYYVKPDAQVKAEIEAGIKEDNWLKRTHRSIFRKIRKKFYTVSKEDAWSDSSYLAKVIMGYVEPKKKIPYIEHSGITVFKIDENILIRPVFNEKPRHAVIKNILENGFYEVMETGEESKVEILEPHRVQRPFKWICVRCGNDDKEMWRDIYELKNWVCCLNCGLVTERTLSGACGVRYNLRNLIRNSIYGGIYYGYDAVKNRDCAIKKCEKCCMKAKKRKGCNDKVSEDIENEWKYHRMICHDEMKVIPYGILQIYDRYEDDEHCYLVLEWADGGELFEYVVNNFTSNEGRFLTDKIAIKNWQLEMQQMFYELCLGVKKMHDSEIVHRDLSLENILLHKNKDYVEGVSSMPKMRPSICDFGLALANEERNFQSQKICAGKVGYMSIECYYGNYDGKANDIWTLGVVLTMMLIGSPPYSKLNDLAYRYYIGGVHSIKYLFGKYKRDFLVTDDAYEVLAGIATKQNKRMTIDKLLATKYCKTAPYPNYRSF